MPSARQQARLCLYEARVTVSAVPSGRGVCVRRAGRPGLSSGAARWSGLCLDVFRKRTPYLRIPQEVISLVLDFFSKRKRWKISLLGPERITFVLCFDVNVHFMAVFWEICFFLLLRDILEYGMLILRTALTGSDPHENQFLDMAQIVTGIRPFPKQFPCHSLNSYEIERDWKFDLDEPETSGQEL